MQSLSAIEEGSLHRHESRHSPPSPVSQRKGPADFCKLLSLGEEFAHGKWVLLKVVHMPQDRDIFFIVWRRKHEYAKPCYAPLNQRHAFNSVRDWKRKLVQCQAWYFSVLLREECFTEEELQEKIQPFLSQDGARHLLAPTMLKRSKKIITGDKLASLPVSAQAHSFIKYVAEADSDELEMYAVDKDTGDVETFIQKVKQWLQSRPDTSSRSPFARKNGLVLPDIKWPRSTLSRDILRKDCGADDVSSQEEWVADILDKRTDFRAALDQLDTPAERASVLGYYSRFQLCGILVAYFSLSKEPLGDRMMNAATNKQGFARIAAEVLMTNLSTQLHVLYVRDYLTADELEVYVRSRAISGEAIMQQRGTLQSYRENERHTLRMFWNKKAHGAARRQLKTDHPPEKDVNELAWIFEGTFRKQKGKCVYCSTTLRIAKGKAWNNASPDRRVPARREGQYEKQNIDIVCVGCQFCKWWYTPTEFCSLLLAMAEARWTESMHCLKTKLPDQRATISEVEQENIVGPWCKKTLSGMKARRDCHLDTNDLLRLLQEAWIGNGFVMDAAGIVVPLESMSIDRINSSIAYKRGNVRLLLWGLNSLKGNDANDLHVIKYLQHLRDNKISFKSQVDVFHSSKSFCRLRGEPS